MAQKPGRAIRRFLRRCINGGRGVISLFLAILMVPFLSVAGALINAGRINSAVAIFDEALCNASNSTLGTYDAFLKSRFGLLAMSQDTASGGAEYTAQQLIEDTFQEYMRVNLGALSNTYFDPTTSAMGIYPLSDPNILITQIDEYGKYTLPTKMVISGLSLDSILKWLTSAGDTAGGIFDTVDSMAGLADDCMSLNDDINDLRSAIGTAEEAQRDKNTAYTAFSDAREAYNTAVSNREEVLANIARKISEAEDTVQEKQSALDTAAQAQKELVDQLVSLENQTATTQQQREEKEAAIQAFKETYEDELEDYLNARGELEDAESELEDLEERKSRLEAKYTSELAEKRTALESARNTYASKLGNFASAVEKVGDSAIEVQDAQESLVNSGVSVASNVAGNIADVITDSQDKAEENLTEDYNKARKEGRTTDMDALSGQIADLKNEKYDVKDGKALVESGFSAFKAGTKESSDFYERDFTAIYAAAYQSIINTKVQVEKYTVPGQDNVSAGAVSAYQVTVPVGITTAEVDQLEKDAAATVTEASFLSVCKALLSFLKALFSISFFYDWELTSEVSGDYYADQGGLPSRRDRTDARYSLTSEYDEADHKQSEAYKELLNAYMDENSMPLSGNSLEDILGNVIRDINKILECMDNLGGIGFFKAVGELISAIADLVKDLWSLFTSIKAAIANAVQRRIILASYIGYNTPNRTTYTGKALTGATFSNSLPHLGDNSGMGFWGAETEYILEGCASEIDNQTRTFWKVYLVRLLINIPFVAINSDVAQLATEATAATSWLGAWGGVLVYLAYFLLEPFVDTLVLVNGSTVPIAKLKLYLTPKGIPELIKAFTKMPIKDEATRESVQEKLNSATNAISPGTGAVTLPDKQGAAEPDIDGFVDAINMDYTKTLILLMALYLPEECIKRLGDVIQMEATCYAQDISPYAFNLDHSYTCIRASGQFDGHEFIKLSDTGILTSTNRVIYRGY